MPRNVRNFWISVTADGVKHSLATGPRTSGGEATITVQYRRNGDVSSLPVTISCKCDRDGKLSILAAVPSSAEPILLSESRR